MTSNESLAWEFKTFLKKKLNNSPNPTILETQATPFIKIDQERA